MSLKKKYYVCCDRCGNISQYAKNSALARSAALKQGFARKVIQVPSPVGAWTIPRRIDVCGICKDKVP